MYSNPVQQINYRTAIIFFQTKLKFFNHKFNVHYFFFLAVFFFTRAAALNLFAFYKQTPYVEENILKFCYIARKTRKINQIFYVFRHFLKEG